MWRQEGEGIVQQWVRHLKLLSVEHAQPLEAGG